MFNPIKWLLEKNEPATKETTVTDITASDTTSTDTATTITPEVSTVQTAPVVDIKNKGVNDLLTTLAFIDGAMKYLPDTAKAEVIAIAQKYL